MRGMVMVADTARFVINQNKPIENSFEISAHYFRRQIKNAAAAPQRPAPTKNKASPPAFGKAANNNGLIEKIMFRGLMKKTEPPSARHRNRDICQSCGGRDGSGGFLDDKFISDVFLWLASKCCHP